MILSLQQFIYQKINKKQITDKVSGIYYQVPANSNFPYIYIGDFSAKNISTKDKEFAEISFKLNIYFRDKNLKSMLELSGYIKQELKNDAQIIIRFLEEKIALQTDGITGQIIMLFNARMGR